MFHILREVGAELDIKFVDNPLFVQCINLISTSTILMVLLVHEQSYNSDILAGWSEAGTIYAGHVVEGENGVL